MLPAAILTYDIIVFQGGGAVVFKRALKYTLPLGIVILGIACLYRNPVTLFDYSWREFTLLERGLTEPRILMFYISQIFFPAPSRMNLLHHVPVSSSLIDPVTTFLSVAGIMILVVPAVIFSHRYKLFSLAIFFYFINHALESTIIPLELIYEHRNYLPSLFIYLWAVSGIAGAVFKTNNQVFKCATCILAFLCVFAQYHITPTRSGLFIEPDRLWGIGAQNLPA